MSSDESISTQLSVVSSRASVSQKKLKKHKPEQWEIQFIGNFLLSLYHRLLIGPQENWICKKSDIREEFAKYVTPELSQRFKDLNGTDHIGTLLQRCGFLSNTPYGSGYYKLKSKEFFEFRNKEIKERDDGRVNGDGVPAILEEGKDVGQPKSNDSKVCFEVDENSPEHVLNYEGTTIKQRRKNYIPTNTSCCICQLDFSSMDLYEEHIQMHNDESDFQYLKELSKFDAPIFKISYRSCKKSHYFCFTLNTKSDDLIIEKIIIVQSRTMFYVHEMQVPYEMPSNGIENFYVDSHLFQLYLEHPIVIICHLSDTKESRIIEQHHFLRNIEMPKIHFAIKPYRIPCSKEFKPLFKVPHYLPPTEIQHALQNDYDYKEKLMEASNEFRDYIRSEKVLQPQTIGPTLKTLLHVEDMDTIKEYMKLMQQEVTLKSFGDSYSFKIKAKQRVFIENILSTYDEIILTFRKIPANSNEHLKLILSNQADNSKSSETFFGRIEDINSGRITFVAFGNRLDLKRQYTVIFRPSRIIMRYQYRALELLTGVMPYLSKFLFPNKLIPKPPSTIRLELFNKSIYDNPEQWQAVRNIAEGPRNDATYIIFGPPGTGKTTTLVESILQLLKRDNTKILVTASSNSACDELALRICKGLDSSIDIPNAIARIYAQSNEARIDNIDDLLLEYSNLYNYSHFYPDVEILHEYRIVVCTMSVVAKLATGKFGRQSGGGTLFTHLFIDEVAAATEVEALLPITSVMTPKSCLIIAGDHKQLGPILKSKRAEELNLGVSLMDRLLARECYLVNTDTGSYDRSIQTRLRLNFRSHPAIVNLYSAMYYNYNLEAKAKLEDVSLFKDWHLSPSKQYPIIFHCINGQSKCDNSSFSLYNSEEIDTVMDYVKDLMYFGINGKPVEEKDIGIISPYKKQYMRIREELNLRKWYLIETGSVENFQGREKNIIIVSFVRSNTQSLGFLESSRRLNVTISRAKSLLILVGNPNTLGKNSEFQHIINECKHHNTLVGKIYNNNKTLEVTMDSNAMDLLSTKLKDCNLKNIQKQYNNNKKQNNTRSRKMYGQQKENVAGGSDSEDDKDEDEEKPSTSKEAFKNKSKIKNNSNKRESGKISKTYKGANAKGDKINLDQYFNTLPNVPNTVSSTKSEGGGSELLQEQQQQSQQQHIPYNNGPQMFPHPVPLWEQQPQPRHQGVPFVAQSPYHNGPQRFYHYGPMTGMLPFIQREQQQQFMHQQQFYMQQFRMMEQQQQQPLLNQFQHQKQQQKHKPNTTGQTSNKNNNIKNATETGFPSLSDDLSKVLKELDILKENEKTTSDTAKTQKKNIRKNKNELQKIENDNKDNLATTSKPKATTTLASKKSKNKLGGNNNQKALETTTETKKLHHLNAAGSKVSKVYKFEGKQVPTIPTISQTFELLYGGGESQKNTIKQKGSPAKIKSTNFELNGKETTQENTKIEKGSPAKIKSTNIDLYNKGIIQENTKIEKDYPAKIKSSYFDLDGKGVTQGNKPKEIGTPYAFPPKPSVSTPETKMETKLNTTAEKRDTDTKSYKTTDLHSNKILFGKVETTVANSGGNTTSISTTTTSHTTSNIYPVISNNSNQSVKTTVNTSNELNCNTARENIYPTIMNPTTTTTRVNNTNSSSQVPIRNIYVYNEDRNIYNNNSNNPTTSRPKKSDDNCIIA